MKISIGSFVLEEASFGHRGDLWSQPAGQVPPSASLDLGTELMRDENGSNVVVRLRAASNAPETVYTFAVSYVVHLILDLEGEAPPDDLDKRLLVTGATMAMPFVRELVANLTSRGRFGPSWIAPTDFNKIVATVTPEPVSVRAG